MRTPFLYSRGPSNVPPTPFSTGSSMSPTLLEGADVGDPCLLPHHPGGEGAELRRRSGGCAVVKRALLETNIT